MQCLVAGTFFAVVQVRIIYEVQCGVCGLVSTHGHRYLQGELCDWGAVPEGWHVVDGMPYCDKHVVNVREREGGPE